MSVGQIKVKKDQTANYRLILGSEYLPCFSNLVFYLRAVLIIKMCLTKFLIVVSSKKRISKLA